MNEYFILLKRELRSILKEKTIVFAIIIQFFIASFSSIILVGVMAFYDPSSIGETSRVTFNVGIVSDTNNRLRSYLREERIRVRSFPDLPAAEEAFRAGQVDTIIVIPESQSGVVDMKLFLPTMDVKKTIILLKLNGPLKKYENYLRETNGIRLNYQETKGKSNTTYEFLYSVIIPILMLFPALIAGSIVIDTVSEEFENKTFDTLVSAPVSLGQIFASKLSAAVTTVVVQVIMWSALLRLNGLPIQRPELVIPFAVIIATIVCFVAAIISLYFKDRERSQFVYSIVLVMGVGGSYFLDASPFSLITRLAAGVPNVGALEVALYLLPLILIGLAFFRVSKRLVLAHY